MLDMRHNLVNILYTIKGLTETHQGRFEEGSFEDHENALSHAQEALKKIYHQSERALSITKRIQLVMTSKTTEGPSEPISAQAVWNKVTALLPGRCEMNRFEILCHIPEHFPNILCDSRDLTEIFCCLAENAIQASQGQGKLIIRAHLGFTTGEEPKAHFMIADTGPGMPEELLHSLFNPFVTTKPPESGNGALRAFGQALFGLAKLSRLEKQHECAHAPPGTHRHRKQRRLCPRIL